MTQKISILIADSNQEFSREAAAHASDVAGMDVTACLHDGSEVLEAVRKLEPDILLIDIVIAHEDGLSVIEKILNSDFAKKPAIFAVSSFFSENIVQEASSLGVRGYFIKPIAVQTLFNRILNSYNSRLAQSDERDALAQRFKMGQYSNAVVLHRINVILQNINIPSHIKGFKYLREAIYMVFIDSKAADDMNILYKRLAEMFHTSQGGVERAIRTAIDQMWDRNESEHIARMFDRSYGKPRNSQVVLKAAHELRMHMYSML